MSTMIKSCNSYKDYQNIQQVYQIIRWKIKEELLPLLVTLERKELQRKGKQAPVYRKKPSESIQVQLPNGTSRKLEDELS